MTGTSSLRARELTPLLNVIDGNRSARFYCDNLGFRIDNQFETDGKLLWAQLSCGPVRIMINASSQRRARVARDHAETYDDIVLYFMVDDARALRQTLIEGGCDPGPVTREAYGLDEFTLRDPDGYELAFGSRARL